LSEAGAAGGLLCFLSSTAGRKEKPLRLEQKGDGTSRWDKGTRKIKFRQDSQDFQDCCFFLKHVFLRLGAVALFLLLKNRRRFDYLDVKY